MREFANIALQIDIGDVWVFQDNSIEYESIAWRVVSISGSLVTIKKATGRDIGYTETIESRYFSSPKWRRILANPFAPEVAITFNCPECNEPNPIPLDDYMCKTCRHASRI